MNAPSEKEKKTKLWRRWDGEWRRIVACALKQRRNNEKKKHFEIVANPWTAFCCETTSWCTRLPKQFRLRIALMTISELFNRFRFLNRIKFHLWKAQDDAPKITADVLRNKLRWEAKFETEMHGKHFDAAFAVERLRSAQTCITLLALLSSKVVERIRILSGCEWSMALIFAKKNDNLWTWKLQETAGFPLGFWGFLVFAFAFKGKH